MSNKTARSIPPCVTPNAPDGVLFNAFLIWFAAIARTFRTLNVTSAPSSRPTILPSIQPSKLPSTEPTFRPSVAPTLFPSSSPTKRPVTPQNCYLACDIFFSNDTDVTSFFFNLYTDEQGREVCGCCPTCEVKTPIPDGVVYATTESFAPTSVPSSLPTTAPTPACAPVHTKAKMFSKKAVKPGKKLMVAVAVKALVEDHRRRKRIKRDRAPNDAGIEVMLPSNVTFLKEFVFKTKGNKGYALVVDGQRLVIRQLRLQPWKVVVLLVRVDKDALAGESLTFDFKSFVQTSPTTAPCYTGHASAEAHVSEHAGGSGKSSLLSRRRHVGGGLAR